MQVRKVSEKRTRNLLSDRWFHAEVGLLVVLTLSESRHAPVKGRTCHGVLSLGGNPATGTGP